MPETRGRMSIDVMALDLASPGCPPGGGLRRMGAQMMFNDFLERYFSFLAV